MRPDHPRSRGVYGRREILLLAMMGSSPLARGLPLKNARAELERRIIPARAGFTHPLPERECGEEDHPRSRGVYLPRTYQSVA